MQYKPELECAMPVRLAIVGCGYVTAVSHLPAAQLVPEVEVAALVDLQLDRAAELARAYGVAQACANYRDVLDTVDAVIVAVPHHMHLPVVMDCLAQGRHVLVEKPMALSTADCREMISAAESSGALLAVGLMRRFYDSNLIVKQLLDNGFLGRAVHFEGEEAVPFSRFNASPFAVLPPSGGVLWDTGPHLLDLLLWWLGDFVEIDYKDDAAGGVEANCEIHLRTATGVTGVVLLSRTRRLSNSVRIFFEDGGIQVSTHDPRKLSIESARFSGPVEIAAQQRRTDVAPITPYFARQLANLAAAIRGKESLMVPGSEGIRSVKVIERCKASRTPLPPDSWSLLSDQVLRRLSA